MNEQQQKIVRIGVISGLLGVALILGYILASPPAQTDTANDINNQSEKDIDVSSPIEKEPYEMELSERLRSLNQLEFLDLLVESGDLTDLETAVGKSTILIPTQFDDVNVRSYLIPEEFYTSTIAIPSTIVNSAGENVEISLNNGEIVFNILGETYSVIDPDLQFNNGSIFIIREE